MTDHKKMIEQYRQKTRPVKSEMVVFRVTPDEYDLLMETYGSMAGIRDFALASTSSDQGQIEMKSRLDADKVDEDVDQD